ncbi:WD-40 repeat-containing protein [Nostoc sp. NIES-3756]|uniref:nSTAND1 domain-containing NTPase n=1 Tax=Nostoc sp. NIES-3756 TaxID=1751286 RepID=UPI000721E03D|nr:caspase family protein [Nostoc sp. NIES-3756]BAT51983.1 WD-40 repeat-containing protein [Nostoc sp. NIES-3756]
MASEWAAQVIGINYYPNYTKLTPLTAAAEDAEKIARHLEKYGYRSFRVQCLPETLNQKGESKIDRLGAVKVQELREAVANLFNPPEPNPVPETALFFFSGHGWCKTGGGKQEVFLVTSDAYPEAEIYGIPLSWLGEQLQISRAKRVIVWLDCCYSGELLKYIPNNKDYCLITATRSYETGVEIPHTQGLLTQTLLAGLNPENDPDGIINSHKLADFITSRMPDTVQRPLIANSLRAILLTTKFPQKSFQDNCPYRSLSYFTETKEDAEVFFGRSALTRQLIQQVREQHRLVAVLGASGSGKSSLLRAGLLYQLKLGQEIPGSGGWKYITPFTPKENPVNSLLEAFSKITLLNPSALQRGKTEKSSSLPLPRGRLGRGDFVRILSEGLKALNTPVIVIIDQLEECFTMGDDSQRQKFFDCLRELIDSTDNLYIFLGMRSDFRGRLREYPEFASKIQKPYINVEHLNRQEIEEAITKPADWVGLGIDNRLKQQLINDVEDYPGSLPLLQYTLTELWRESRKQGDEFLSLKTYEDLGGVEGTLQKRADAVYESLSPIEQIVARRLFLELTQMGETTDVRRRVRLHELVNSHHSLELLQQVSDKLADKDARLITKTDEPDSHDVILDVVHEALIRHWQKLRDWKEEYKLGIAIERQMEVEAQEWNKNAKKEGFLRKDDRLAVAEAYLARFGDWQMLNGVAQEYIYESQKLRDRLEQDKKESIKIEAQRKQRNQFVITFASVSLGLAGLAVYQWWNAQQNAQVAQQQGVIALAQISETALISNNHLEAAVASLQSGRQLLGKPLNNANLEQTAQEQAVLALKRAIYNTILERKRLEGHRDLISSVVFSRDGRNIASASADKSVKIWDAVTGEELATFKGHSDRVVSVAFSPDGRTIASASAGKSVKLWNRSTGSITTLNGHRKSVNKVAFSPDGRTIASASADNTVKLWDTARGKLIITFNGHSDKVISVAFSPNGRTIASASADNTAKLWDTGTGKLIATVKHSDAVWDVAFSPDGKVIASASLDKSVKLWDTNTGKPITTLNGHSDAVWSLAFSPNSRTLVSASADNTVKLWDTGTGKLLSTFNGHSSAVNSVAFSPDGKTIASASTDKSIILWDAGTDKEITTFYGHSSAVNSVAFSLDSRTLASASADNTVKLWDLATSKIIFTLNGHSSAVSSVAFSSNGRTLASASADNTVKLWDVGTGKIIFTLNGHSKSVKSVVFSPNARTLASASADNTVKLWDVGTGKIIFTLNGHSSAVNNVAFSPDGRTLASAGNDRIVLLWDVVRGKEITALTGHSDRVVSVAFTTDGRAIASASADSIGKLWYVATGKEITDLSGHSDKVMGGALSPDSKTLASTSGNTIKLWDAAPSQEITDLDGYSDAVWGLALNPHGKRVIWNAAKAKPITNLNGHRAKVITIIFSPDGKTLASASADNTIKLWRVYPNNLDDLISYSCARLNPYLQSHPNVSDRTLCNDIPTNSD